MTLWKSLKLLPFRQRIKARFCFIFFTFLTPELVDCNKSLPHKITVKKNGD